MILILTRKLPHLKSLNTTQARLNLKCYYLQTPSIDLDTSDLSQFQVKVKQLTHVKELLKQFFWI